MALVPPPGLVYDTYYVDGELQALRGDLQQHDHLLERLFAFIREQTFDMRTEVDALRSEKASIHYVKKPALN